MSTLKPHTSTRQPRTSTLTGDPRAALLDAALAIGFVVVGFLSTAGAQGDRARDGTFVALVLLVALPYAGRRLAPVPVYLVSLLTLATMAWMGYPTGRWV